MQNRSDRNNGRQRDRKRVYIGAHILSAMAFRAATLWVSCVLIVYFSVYLSRLTFGAPMTPSAVWHETSETMGPLLLLVSSILPWIVIRRAHSEADSRTGSEEGTRRCLRHFDYSKVIPPIRERTLDALYRDPWPPN